MNKKTVKSDRQLLIEARLQAVGIKNVKSAVKIGKNAFVVTDFIPTGVDDVDSILGVGGGIPRGIIVEFCGESGSGKTWLALNLIAQAQKSGLRSAFMNVERTFYPPRAQSIGIDMSEGNDLFELYEPAISAEKWGDLIVAMVESGEYGVIVVDSVSALVPEADFDKGLEDNAKVGAHAQFINRWMKKLLPACDETKTLVVLINQFRMGAGVRPNTMALQSVGGKGIEYFSGMRLWFNKVNGADGIVANKMKQTIGGKSKLRVMKTRYGQPDLAKQFTIMFTDDERDPVAEFMMRATDKYKGVIAVNRGMNSYVDTETGEVYCKSKDPLEFIQMLVQAPPQSKLAKGDASENGFEWVCGKVKIDAVGQQKILSAVEQQIALALNMVYGDQLVPTDEEFVDTEE